jgi:prevent-host-death family protein
MKTTTFSQFRNNAKKFFDAVERGEIIEIYRHGKPIALLSPARENSQQHWKDVKPLALAGVSLSEVILSERKKDS